jgi:hypothetical protein
MHPYIGAGGVFRLTVNACEGIKALYKSDRAEIIWKDADIARIKTVATTEIAHGTDLAAAPHLRPDRCSRRHGVAFLFLSASLSSSLDQTLQALHSRSIIRIVLLDCRRAGY